MEDERRIEALKDGKMRKSSTADKVMQRIRREQAWAYPVTMSVNGETVHRKKWFFIYVLILFLLTYMLYTSSLTHTNIHMEVWASSLDTVVGSGELQVIPSGERNVAVKLDHMVAGIGDAPLLYTGRDGTAVTETGWAAIGLLLLHLYLIAVWFGWKRKSRRSEK